MQTSEIKQKRVNDLYNDLDLLIEEYRASLTPAEFGGTTISYLMHMLMVCSEGNLEATMDVIRLALRLGLDNYRKSKGDE